jgi:hypothetical protein
MLTFIAVTINLLFIIAISVIALALGFWLGSLKRNKVEEKIRHLEIEMLNSHAEILRLSKEIAEKEMAENKTLVVPIHEIPNKKTRENRPST